MTVINACRRTGKWWEGGRMGKTGKTGKMGETGEANWSIKEKMREWMARRV